MVDIADKFKCYYKLPKFMATLHNRERCATHSKNLKQYTKLESTESFSLENNI